MVLVTHSRDEGADAATTTTEILRRVFTLATTPLNVTIVDNASDGRTEQRSRKRSRDGRTPRW